MKTKTSHSTRTSKTAKVAGKTATRAFTQKQEDGTTSSKRPMRNTCVCGCGLPCHKLFKQGHDQRARSQYLNGTATQALKDAIRKGLLVPKMDAHANAVLKINRKPSKLVKKQTRRAA